MFLHIVGVFGFLASHGASMAVTFKIRRERDPARVAELVTFSGGTITWFYVSLGVLLVGGIVAGFLGEWWGRAWIWASIAVLVLTSVSMYAMARPYFRRVGLVARSMAAGSRAVTEEQFDELLASRAPVTIAAIGIVGLAAILYFMMFKPSLGFGTAAEPGPSPDPGAVSITAVPTLSFDGDVLEVPAGRSFDLVFDNREPGVPHNVSIYTDGSAATALFTGDIIQGGETITYPVPALDAGEWFFRCDVHPSQMTGTVIASEE
ncbi:MAG: cupredoxin domain-containing protein [Actinobacteria bacterium]|nr:cupredoxin domain-containing protein [Actinomycetota bacterium]